MPSTFVWIVDGREFIAPASPSSTFISPTTFELAARLSDSEQTRWQHFLKPQRAREFLLGRLLLRHALMQVTACRVDEIDVVDQPGASPQVNIGGHPADGVSMPGFSLSHSRGWLACAVGDRCSVGVDIEASALQRDVPALAGAAFTAQEQAWLAARQHDDAAFYRLWCAKEALYKFQHNAGMPTPQALPILDMGADASVPSTAAAFLHHESGDDYHLCLCSAARPLHHTSERIDCNVLLNLPAA